MSKPFWYLHRRKRKKVNAEELAAQLAPLEEIDKRAAQKQVEKSVAEPQVGSIVVDDNSIQIPSGVADGYSRKHFLGIEPVVLVIVCLMLAFIVFIAWQISMIQE